MDLTMDVVKIQGNVPRTAEERAWPGWVAWSSPRCWPLNLLLPETDKLLPETGFLSFSNKSLSNQNPLLCAQLLSRVRLWDPMDCSPPGSSIHGDSPGRNTGVGCLPSSRWSSQRKSPALQEDCLPSEPPGKPFGILFLSSLKVTKQWKKLKMGFCPFLHWINPSLVVSIMSYTNKTNLTVLF